MEEETMEQTRETLIRSTAKTSTSSILLASQHSFALDPLLFLVHSHVLEMFLENGPSGVRLALR